MENFLRYSAPATAFEEALPLGNGQLGAMVYGKNDVERISLNHDTLWSGKPGDSFVEGAYESNEKARILLEQGKRYEAQREIENNFTGEYLCSYMLLGALYIKNLNSQGEVSDYKRTLDLENGMVKVSYMENGVVHNREYLVSNPHNCMMVKLATSEAVSYELFGNCVGKSHVTSFNDTLYFSGECPTSLAPEYIRHEKPVYYDGEGVRVTAIAKVKTDGNVVKGAGEKITVENAKEVVIYFVTETSFVDFDKLPDKKTFEPCFERMKALYEIPYCEIKKEHISDFSSLYNRVKADFGGKEDLSDTDERLKRSEKDAGLCELLYNFGRYLIIAGSREGTRATNLQGIWNESYYAPWSSNYTLNINAEMNYWPVLMNDLASCNLPIIEQTKNISINGAKTARELYHADGFVAHHNSDLWAHTTPVGAKKQNSSQYAYWNLSGGWLCRHLFEHYEYTMDKEYLEKTAYPIMKECAKFYLSVMKECDGKWLVTPSTSPENSYMLDGKQIYLAKYTTMSQSIVEDLFKNISKSAKILGIYDEFTREIDEKKDRIGIYKAGSDGQLLEYDGDFEEFDVYHRHVSHLYGFYPADVITTENNPEVTQMVRRTLERRGDEGTGWSMGWKVCLWARLKDGDHALKLVKNQLRFMPAKPDRNVDMWHSGGTYANMFDAHPPFQIDGNYGVCAGIAQMFLQCEDGKVKILPALPTEFANGSIKGLLAKGNIKVDIEWKNNKLTYLKLVTPIKQTAIINIDGCDKTVELEANTEYIYA